MPPRSCRRRARTGSTSRKVRSCCWKQQFVVTSAGDCAALFKDCFALSVKNHRLDWLTLAAIRGVPEERRVEARGWRKGSYVLPRIAKEQRMRHVSFKRMLPRKAAGILLNDRCPLK